MPVSDEATTPTLGQSAETFSDTFNIDLLIQWLNKPLVHLAGVELSISSLTAAILIFILFLMASRLIRRMLKPWLNRQLRHSPGVAYAILRFIHYLIVAAGIFTAFRVIGLDLGSLALVLGFLSVGIGFGLQNITSNFISGLILLLERPISVGDFIRVGDHTGRVQEIRMRSTLILTQNSIAIIVPNSRFIEDDVVNWSHGSPRIRIHVPVGVAYGSDLDKVREALLQVAAEHPDVLKNPEPDVRFLEFADSSLNMDLLVWIDRPSDQFQIHSQINFAVDAAFRRADINIPFPQRDLNLQMTEAVRRLAQKGNSPD